MPFPAELTNAVDNVTEIVAAHLNNLEAKVGVDGSTVAASLDYLLKNPASLNPGHKHSKLWALDGDLEAVTVDANGNVGLGTASPQRLLHVYQAGTGYLEPACLENPGDPGNGATRLVVKNSVASFFLQAYGSAAPGSLASAAAIVANTGTKLLLGAAASGMVQIYANNQYNSPQFTLDAAGHIGIGTTAPNAAALLHLVSTSKGFLPPVMTTAQKTAIGSPPAGLLVYDSTLNKLCVYTGAAWQTVMSS